ncbi:hypothetical protein [Roseateles toxinivorans]|uniref:Uncharacterized protein n=1 Tax=Roseateles toxinivorans TaxID=270368 RepID=A0A4R6QJ49_9BURK|nr:hypothetical protein [Roseateles toxinivorans]TDP63157.1 hypothetical protein DES47_105158 [Roseateles toxinivorans]
MISTKFSGYRRDGRRVLPFDLGGDAPPPPDYTPMANASAETARLSAEMSQKQLDEAKRQYDNNMGIARPIVDAQLQVMQQGLAQGQDYYDYMKSRQRPVEDALQSAALADNSSRDAAERQAIIDARNGLAGKVGDVGARQRAFGMEAAGQLDERLGGVADRYRSSTGSALDDYRADSQRYSDESGAINSNFRATSAAEMARLYGIFGDSVSRLDSSLGESDAAMRAAAASASGAASSIMSNSGRYEGQINDDIALYTGGNDAIRKRYGTDIENDAALAMADARTGQANATNSAIRQAMRYGLNTSSIASDTALKAAQAQAAAANGTRVASTDRYRATVGEGIGMRQNLMNSSNSAAIAAANAQLAAAQMASSGANNRGSNALSRAGFVQSAASDITGKALDSARTWAAQGLGALGDRAGMDGNYANARFQTAGAQAGMDATTAGTIYDARKAASDGGFASELSSADILATSPSLARDLRINDDSRSNARLLDAAGLYRNMPGASAGAYGLAVNAGNSANANNMAPGQSYMQGMNSANSTTLSGRQIAQQGLGSILGAQTSYASLLANQDSGAMGAFGTIAGSAITAF